MSDFGEALGQALENALAGKASRLFPNGLTIIRDPNQEPVYTCPVCQDKGIVPVEVDRSRRVYGPYAGTGTIAVRCLCETGRKNNEGSKMSTLADVWPEHRLLAYWPSGVPAVQFKLQAQLKEAGFMPVMTTWTLATYREQLVSQRRNLRPFAKYAQVWIETDKYSRADVVIYGPPGTGKTGLAVSIARGCIERGETVLISGARDLFNRWRETIKPDGPSEEDVLSGPREVDVLVLDELGGTKLTEFVGDYLLALIDYRQKSRKPTILTLNLPPKVLANETEQIMRDLFGPALFDRLVQGTFWYLDGESVRTSAKVIPLK